MYYSTYISRGNHTKEDEMGEACDTLGRDFFFYRVFFETLEEKDHVKQMDV